MTKVYFHQVALWQNELRELQDEFARAAPPQDVREAAEELRTIIETLGSPSRPIVPAPETFKTRSDLAAERPEPFRMPS